MEQNSSSCHDNRLKKDKEMRKNHWKWTKCEEKGKKKKM